MKSCWSLILMVLIAACSGSDNYPAASDSNRDAARGVVSPTLTLHESNRSAKGNSVGPDANIIKLDEVGLWTDWGGNPVTVQLDTQATNDDALMIRNEAGKDTTLVRILVDQPLIAGATYTLDVGENATPGSAAIIFPFSDVSRHNAREIVDVSREGEDFAIAYPGAPFSFVAPPLIKGFWVQFQTAYQSGEDAAMDPRLGATETPVVVTNGDNLIDSTLPFRRWFPVDAQSPGYSANVATGEITIDREAISGPSFNSQGVLFHYDVPIRGDYRLEIYDANTTGILIMLFGLDAGGKIQYDIGPGVGAGYLGIFSESARIEGSSTIVQANNRGFALMVQPAFPVPPNAVADLPRETKFKVRLRPVF